MSNSRFGLRTRQGEVRGIVEVSPTTLILDRFGGAAAAYSLRKLRTSYTGAAIRVRRSNDNAEQDIGFSADILDTSALITFCGANNGFVTTWYDQSGNGRNATQTSSINQPQIVSSGSVILDNGKSSISFTSASSQSLRFNGLVYTTNTVFGTIVFSLNATAAFSVILSQNSGPVVGRSNLLALDSSTPKKSLYFFNNGTTYNNLSSGTITDNTQTLMTNYSFDDDYYNALNGGAANNNISNQSFTPASSLGTGIGGQPNGFNYLNGKIQEIIVWNSNQSSSKTEIESEINLYYGIY